MPVRNAPSPLPTTLRFIASRLRHRLAGRALADEAPGYRRAAERTLARLPEHVERCDWFEVEATRADWFDTGLSLAEGETVTVLAAGRLYLSKPLDIGVGPTVGLWYRIGDGSLAKFIGPGETITAASAGRLFVVTKPPGEFADRQGRFESDPPRGGVSGRYLVGILRWRGELESGLAAAAEICSSVFAPALRRWQAPVQAPSGWHYLWRLGQGEIFSIRPACAGAPAELCCHTSGDVGILQFPVDLPLTAETRLNWSWCVTELPSRLPEHIQPTHDYLSIALEFDNGLDLTWLWSAELPVDTIFQCPLPWWDQRETHWVVRSGSRGLGQWCAERRAVLADYERAIGGAPPARIVAVWLIANTAFQRGVGQCRYRGIVLEDGSRKLVVQA